MSISVAAEIMMTGVSSSRFSLRSCSSTSMPLFLGIMTSSSMASNGHSAFIASASSPSEASITLW